MTNPALRGRVFNLYRNLHFILKSYPVEGNQTIPQLHKKLNNAFRANANLNQTKDIEKKIEFGWYIYNEIESLIHLSMYRTLKRRYSWQAPSVDDLLGEHSSRKKK
mmetsp:Transcript_2039/g.2938  ORF Transcript_2039/g.2938 Transcript_2039/m.2938 type:complete len:106 (+) Transcript_2039:31-348(+)